MVSKSIVLAIFLLFCLQIIFPARVVAVVGNRAVNLETGEVVGVERKARSGTRQKRFIDGEVVVRFKKKETPQRLRLDLRRRTERERSLAGRIANRVENFKLRLAGKNTSEELLTNLNHTESRLGISRKEYAGNFMLAHSGKGEAVDRLIQGYAGLENVEVAGPNLVRFIQFVPNDYYCIRDDSGNCTDKRLQWHFQQIQMEEAWDLSKGKDVVVAVIDSGVAYEDYGGFLRAPDLAGTSFVWPKNFLSGSTHANDDNSHGTHVAGTIAQTTNNNLGVAGIAFRAKIMPLKVCNWIGCPAWAIAEAIEWAADHGAKVINLSLGSSGPDPTGREQEAIVSAYSKGVAIVAAAGNDGSLGIDYPAAYDEVIAVGAVRFDKRKAWYSDHGSELELVAPGGDMNVDQNGDGYRDGVLQQTFNPQTQDPTDFGYWFLSGTSMASPHVAGVVALLIAKGNATTPQKIRTALRETAQDLGSPGRDDFYGYGLVQAAAALNWHGRSPTPTPAPTRVPPTAIPTLTPIPTSTPTLIPISMPPAGCGADVNCSGEVDHRDIVGWRRFWQEKDSRAELDGNRGSNVLDYLLLLAGWL